MVAPAMAGGGAFDSSAAGLDGAGAAADTDGVAPAGAIGAAAVDGAGDGKAGPVAGALLAGEQALIGSAANSRIGSIRGMRLSSGGGLRRQ